MGTIDVGELLYEYTVKLTGMTEYGVSFAALMAGTVPPPATTGRLSSAGYWLQSGRNQRITVALP